MRIKAQENAIKRPVVIINTEAENENEINESINNIKSQQNGILILKDRIIIKTGLSTNTVEYSYKNISEKYNINKIDKEELIKILSGQETELLP